jgi:hypothetical protein
MIIKQIQKIKCLRCEHDWTPRGKDIRICPKCKSPYFDRPRRYPKPGGVAEEQLPEDPKAGASPIKRRSLKKLKPKPKKRKKEK